MESRIEMEVELRTGTKRGIGWLVASFHGRFLSRVLVRTERTSCDCWWDESRSNRKDKLQKKSLKREIKPQCIQRHTRWKVWSFQLIYLLFLFIYLFIFLFFYLFMVSLVVMVWKGVFAMRDWRRIWFCFRSEFDPAGTDRKPRKITFM